MKIGLTDTQRQVASSVGLVLIAIGVGAALMSRADVDSYTSTLKTDTKDVMSTFDLAKPMQGSDPVRLRVPDLSIDTNFVPLGLQDNGEVEVPKGYTEVGWYTNGPTPGELGPAVVLGHIDSYEGPGVFVHLGFLQPGDYIYIDREDGTTATFRVTELQRYDRNEFPTDKVYGDLTYPGLRLITCSGTYSHQSLEYNRVLVVYAALVNDTRAQ